MNLFTYSFTGHFSGDSELPSCTFDYLFQLGLVTIIFLTVNFWKINDRVLLTIYAAELK